MACASCMRKADSMKAVANGMTTASSPQPFMAADIQVVDGGEVRKFQASDWDNDKHKLLILLPEIFTITCTDQIMGMKKWYPEFQKLNCEMILLMTDPAAGILDWFESEELLHDRPYKAFSSYMMPSRLGLLNNGRAKRGAVLISTDGEVVKQEAFSKVAPAFSELHRILWAHTTGNHCGSDWTNPADSLD